MFFPPNSQAMPLNAITPIWISQFSLPCDDSKQNPSIGKRCVQLGFRLQFNNAGAVGPNYFIVDMAPYINSGFLDKILSVEFSDLWYIYTLSDFTVTTFNQPFIGCDGSNQFIGIGGTPGASYDCVRDVQSPTSRFYIFANPFVQNAAINSYFSLTFANFSRTNAQMRT